MNILEILKKCPIGTKLYSTICGECELHNILDDTFNVISDKRIFIFLHDGRYIQEGEVCIFPSKENRDWNKFKIPTSNYKNGDIVYHEFDSGARRIFIVKKQIINNRALCHVGISSTGGLYIPTMPHSISGYATLEEKEKLFKIIKEYGYNWNDETKTLERLIEAKFKDGDIITDDNDDYKSICIFKREGNLKGTIDFYCGIVCNGNFSIKNINEPDSHFGHIIDYRLATKEEKEKLFQRIKDNGYKWNNQTKTLEKLIKDKFDISTLKPFDKVLVRNYNHEEWDIEFFARRNDEKRFETLIGIYDQCIPYEGNEHLFNKNDNCDNYYKTW